MVDGIKKSVRRRTEKSENWKMKRVFAKGSLQIENWKGCSPRDHYKLNVDTDLVPVCPNCHYMLHRKEPPYTIEELKKIIKATSRNSLLRARPSGTLFLCCLLSPHYVRGYWECTSSRQLIEVPLRVDTYNNSQLVNLSSKTSDNCIRKKWGRDRMGATLHKVTMLAASRVIYF